MITLNDELLAAEATISLLRLQQLDVIWTARLKDGSANVSAEDLFPLRSLAQQMNHLLGEAGTAVATLYEIASRNDDELEQRRAQLVQHSSLSPMQREYLQHKSALDGNLLGPLGEVLSAWVDGIKDEREQLQAELEAIDARRSTYGDLSHKFLCELCVGLVVGSLLAGNFPVAAMSIGVAAGIGC